MDKLICGRWRTICRGRRSGTCVCRSYRPAWGESGWLCGWWNNKWGTPQPPQTRGLHSSSTCKWPQELLHSIITNAIPTVSSLLTNLWCNWPKNRASSMIYENYSLTQHDFQSGVGCLAPKTFHTQVSFQCLLGGSVEVWMKNILYQPLRVKLISASKEMLNRVWPLMNLELVVLHSISNTSSKYAQVERNYWNCKQHTNKKIIMDQLQMKVPLSWRITLTLTLTKMALGRLLSCN